MFSLSALCSLSTRGQERNFYSEQVVFQLREKTQAMGKPFDLWWGTNVWETRAG